MFAHSLSGRCIYGEKCAKKLCFFQHQQNDISENEIEANLKNIEKPSEISGDNEVKAVDETNDDDEQMFQTYVQSYHPLILRKFNIEKTIKCYYCEFLPMIKRLKDLEDEMRTHIEENHIHIIEGLDPEIFDDEFHRDFIEFFIEE